MFHMTFHAKADISLYVGGFFTAVTLSNRGGGRGYFTAFQILGITVTCPGYNNRKRCVQANKEAQGLAGDKGKCCGQTNLTDDETIVRGKKPQQKYPLLRTPLRKNCWAYVDAV